jgi:hypothetical protein
MQQHRTGQNIVASNLRRATIGGEVALALVLIRVLAPGVAWAGLLTCLTGTDPSVAADAGQLAAVRTLVDQACPCASFDGSPGKTHAAYGNCAKNEIALAVSNANLRKQCKGTVTKYYAKSTCGFPASQHKELCVKKSLSSGKVTCAIKPSLQKCVDSPGKYTQAACSGFSSCIEAADTNGDGIIGSTDSGACVPATGSISSDPYRNASSFHQTEVEPDTFSYGSTIVATFQVGRFIDGGASNIGWATSTNSGGSWQNGFLPGTTTYSDPPGQYARISDPSVAYDAKHDTWLIATLAIDSSVTPTAVLVSPSTDGGLTWGSPVAVATITTGQAFDKEWIACDDTPASTFYGTCHVEWDDNGMGNALYLSFSGDGGATWTASAVPPAPVIGGQPVVQPNGTVVVPIGDADPSHIESFVSDNGGVSYAGPFAVATISEHIVGGNLRTSPLPSAEVDGTGIVYVVWQDCSFESNCSANDIVMSRSSDGRHWSPVVRIPIDPIGGGVDHFIPGIAVDRDTSGTTAHLALTYYYYPSANCDTSTCQLDVGFVSSTDGGAHWTAPLQLAGPIHLRGLPLTTQGYMVGDYISTSISNGKAYSVFATAKGTACTIGINSCEESIVAVANGLNSSSGLLFRAGLDHPVVSAGKVTHIPGTAF